MLAEERRKIILELIERDGKVIAKDFKEEYPSVWYGKEKIRYLE